MFSQRSADRPSFSLMWECVGGSVLKGEDKLTGAIREVKKEVGVLLSEKLGRLVKPVVRKEVNGVPFRDILDVWLFEYDGSVALEQATTQEVAQTAWLTKAQTQQLLDRGRLVQTLSYLFETEKL